MGLRAIEPFLSLSHPYSASLADSSGPLTDYSLPYSVLGGETGSFPRQVTLTLSGEWLRLSGFGSVSANRRLSIGRKFSDKGITFTDQTVVYGGVRIKIAQFAPNFLVYLWTSAYSGQVLVNSPAVPGGFKLNTEYYVEWCIDLPNNLLRSRIDGVEVAPVALGASWKTALLTQGVYLMYGSPNIGSGNSLDIYLKDGYVLEKTPDGINSSWLGPQIVRPLAVSDVVSSWTSSSGQSGKDTLNQPMGTSASRLTPVLTSNPDTSEAAIQLDASSIQGRVNGVSFQVTAVRTPGKPGNLELQLADGSSVSDKFQLITNSTMIAYNGLLLSHLSPSGTLWTKEKLAALTIKLKPVS